jgi:signal transduction histidine kinase
LATVCSLVAKGFQYEYLLLSGLLFLVVCFYALKIYEIVLYTVIYFVGLIVAYIIFQNFAINHIVIHHWPKIFMAFSVLIFIVHFSGKSLLKHRNLEKLLEEKQKILFNLDREFVHQVNDDLYEIRKKDLVLLLSEKQSELNSFVKQMYNLISRPIKIFNKIYERFNSNFKKIDTELFIEKDMIEKNVLKMKMTIDYTEKILKNILLLYSESCKSEEIKASQLLENVLKIYKYELLAKKVKVKLEVQEDFSMYISSNEIIFAVTNVVQNSIEAYQEKGIEERVIEFIVTVHDGNGRIMINDFAGGIDLKYIDYVLNPYFSTKNEELGVGLYYAKLNVEKNFGEIKLYNDNNGLTVLLDFNIDQQRKICRS